MPVLYTRNSSHGYPNKMAYFPSFLLSMKQNIKEILPFLLPFPSLFFFNFSDSCNFDRSIFAAIDFWGNFTISWCPGPVLGLIAVPCKPQRGAMGLCPPKSTKNKIILLWPQITFHGFFSSN